jgi:hypothetical protein
MPVAAAVEELVHDGDTGWALRVAPDLNRTEAPTVEELCALRRLQSERSGQE